LKNEVITFVILILIFLCVVFKVKIKVRGRSVSVSSIIYFMRIWIDSMQIIAE